MCIQIPTSVGKLIWSSIFAAAAPGKLDSLRAFVMAAWYSLRGRTKFTTSAHDVIASTSPQKNDLCTEELQHDKAKSLDEVSLQLRKARFGCLFIRWRKGTLELTLVKNFTLGGCSSLG